MKEPKNEQDENNPRFVTEKDENNPRFVTKNEQNVEEHRSRKSFLDEASSKLSGGAIKDFRDTANGYGFNDIIKVVYYAMSRYRQHAIKEYALSKLPKNEQNAEEFLKSKVSDSHEHIQEWFSNFYIGLSGKKFYVKDLLEEYASSDFELQRLYDWLMNENREPAKTKFTSGLLRNVANEIEFRLSSKLPSEEYELLNNYSMWLQENGYEPYSSEFPIQFLREQLKK